MAYAKKTWLQRIVQYPSRRRLDDTGTANTYDVARSEGTISQEGDGFTVDNMNDLEKRIEDGFAEKLDIANIANNATTTVSGLALDARMGKTIQDEIDAVNANLSKRITKTLYVVFTDYYKNVDISAYGTLPDYPTIIATVNSEAQNNAVLLRAQKADATHITFVFTSNPGTITIGVSFTVN